MKKGRIPLILACLGCTFAVLAAPPTPPLARLNYQGVLRDSAGNPLDGTFDMEFTFFSASSGGDEIVTDSHSIFFNTAPVTVDGGLFNVVLGSGVLLDGPSPGDYASDFGRMFRDYGTVYMLIRVNAQSLSPRVQVLSAGYCMNGDSLDGLDSEQFLRSDTSDTFLAGIAPTATLTLATGTSLNIVDSFGGLKLAGAGVYSSADELNRLWGVQASVTAVNLSALTNQSTVTLHSHPVGDATTLDGVDSSGFVNTSATAQTKAGNLTVSDLTLSGGDLLFGGSLNFADSGTLVTRATLDSLANLQLVGDLTVSGNDIGFGAAGAIVRASPTTLQLVSGDANTDDLFLFAGNTLDDGSLLVNGDAEFSLYSGNGTFTFNNGAGLTQTASLGGAGDLTIRGDLVVNGLEIQFLPLSGEPAATILHDGGIVFSKDVDNDNASALFQFVTDNAIEQLRIVDGDEAPAYFDGAVNANGIDYAEAFRVSDPTLEPGDVVALRLDAPGFVSRATRAYAPGLVGVVSARPGFVTGNSFDAEEQADPALAARRNEARRAGDQEAAQRYTIELMERRAAQLRPVALLGQVPVKVDGAHGRIAPGDPLTSSPTPGHAMAMTGPGQGIGIALEAWNGSGPGRILAFIDPGYFGARGSSATEPGPTGEPDLASRARIETSGERPSGPQVLAETETGATCPRDPLRARSNAVAEYHPVSERFEEGDVLVADPARPGLLRLGRIDADATVIGIVTDEPGVGLGSRAERIPEAGSDAGPPFHETHAAVALMGTVPCKADAGYGSIRVGDLLTTSPTPGHAMRAVDPRPGTVVAKALEPLDAGTGTIRVLVLLR